MEQTQDKSTNRELQEKFIVLQIESENFVIPLEYVSEIVRVQSVTEAPHQPDWVKGIMNLRDSVISLIDTRKRLGIKSYFEMAHQIIADVKIFHLNWLEKLEESIINNFPFALTLDHTKSDFSKSVTVLSTKADVNHQIKTKFEDVIPIYSEVFSAGKVALEASGKGNNEFAIKKLKEIKSILAPKMIKAFEEIDSFFCNAKDIAVIIEYGGHHFAMLADDITKMKTFKPDNRQKGSLTDNPFISGVFDDDEGLYQELDLKGILTGKNEELLIQDTDNQID